MSLKISIIYGSTRDGRLGIRFAKYLTKEFINRDIEAVLIDPLNMNLETLTKRYNDYDNNSAPKELENIHQELDSSDAFVIVSAEYNHFLPPALVNLLNHFYIEYQRKPSAVATYSVSPFGGVRVSSPCFSAGSGFIGRSFIISVCCSCKSSTILYSSVILIELSL